MADASFSDADPAPLMLRAESAEDLMIISALVQDAILPVTEIIYDSRGRRLALLINRFRWEDRDQAERASRAYERVQALLVISDVLRVQSDGIDRKDADLILSLLSIEWEPGEDGAGRVLLIFAGDGQISVTVECVDIDLRDVTRPYVAPSGQVPNHPD